MGSSRFGQGSARVYGLTDTLKHSNGRARYTQRSQVEGDRHQGPIVRVDQMPTAGIAGVRAYFDQDLPLSRLQGMNGDLRRAPIPDAVEHDGKEQRPTVWQQMWKSMTHLSRCLVQLCDPLRFSPRSRHLPEPVHLFTCKDNRVVGAPARTKTAVAITDRPGRSTVKGKLHQLATTPLLRMPLSAQLLSVRGEERLEEAAVFLERHGGPIVQFPDVDPLLAARDPEGGLSVGGKCNPGAIR